MILKQLIKYDNAPVLEATWVEIITLPQQEIAPGIFDLALRTQEVVIKCHAYSNGQMDMLRADLGADAAAHEALIAEIEATYVEPEPPAISEVRDSKIVELNAEYERLMRVIAKGYPLSERESWPVQTGEARALLADVNAATPWIDQAAAARSVDRLELAQRIVAKDDAYRAIHGALTGVRQHIEDQIHGTGDDLDALLLIDVLAGWPSFEE